MPLTRDIDCVSSLVTIFLSVTRVEPESPEIVTRVEPLTRITLSLHYGTEITQLDRLGGME